MVDVPASALDEMSTIPVLPEGWTRCHAYLERKRRFCRQQHVSKNRSDCEKGPLYCGNHQYLLENQQRKRVPCPVDPSHMVFEDTVAKHVEVCPKTKKQRLEAEQPHFVANCNTGGHGKLETTETPSVSDKLEWAKRVALRVLQVHQKLFQAAKTTDAVVSNITAEQILAALPLVDLSESELKAGIAVAVRDNRIKSGGPRHLHQQASMVGHLRQRGVFSGQEPQTILELGAGRGMAGLVVAGASAAAGVPTELVMVERAGSRGKADTVLRNLQEQVGESYLNLKSLQSWSRVQCDLAHVDMTRLLPKGRKVVVVAKHLCGVGTDLALKSLEPIKGSVSCCIFSTCCHGVCNWKDYVGRDALRSAMEMESATKPFLFGENEFEMLRTWSSGTVRTTPGVDKTRQEGMDEHNTALPEAPPLSLESISITTVVDALGLACGPRGLGRACQRLIDYGRQEYISQLFPVATPELLYYCPEIITPQNALLVAKTQVQHDAKEDNS